MNCAMMQPTFMPWQGFFELILKSDRFVLTDDSQFSPQSYHQRNRLFIARGRADWYTVPVIRDTSYSAPLNQVRVVEDGSWSNEMLKRLQANYGRAPYFDSLYPWLVSWLSVRQQSLADLNIAFISKMCELMHIDTEVWRGSDHPSSKKRSERVLDLLGWCEADRYLCANGSFEYMLEDGLFPSAEVEVVFQDHVCTPYPQIGSPGSFVPYLSVLDAMMNVGPEGVRALVGSGTKRWLTWEDRKDIHQRGGDA